MLLEPAPAVWVWRRWRWYVHLACPHQLLPIPLVHSWLAAQLVVLSWLPQKTMEHGQAAAHHVIGNLSQSSLGVKHRSRRQSMPSNILCDSAAAQLVVGCRL